MHLTRRELLSLGLGVIASPVAARCGRGQSKGDALARTDERRHREGVLAARPKQPEGESPTGERRLGFDRERDGLLYVPPAYRPDRPAPLALMLHGAGGSAAQGLSLLRGFADSSGLILLAPESRRGTWDVIAGEYGPDVAFIERALEKTFERYNIDPGRIAFGGFSDGASYALSLGVTNGDLVTHVVAFSPGFLAPKRRQGSPRLFISHGTRDRVLPIDGCSRRIVRQARSAGYEVLYREFDGPHTIPHDVAREAVGWFLPDRAPAAQ